MAAMEIGCEDGGASGEAASGAVKTSGRGGVALIGDCGNAMLRDCASGARVWGAEKAHTDGTAVADGSGAEEDK